MLGQSPLASEPLASANNRTSVSLVSVDELLPRPLAAIGTVFAISGWVFAGTPVVAPTLYADQPQQPPSRIARPVQRLQPDQFSPLPYQGIDYQAQQPPPRTMARPSQRTQTDQFTPIAAPSGSTADYGWADTSGTRPPLLKKIQLRYQPDPFMPPPVTPGSGSIDQIIPKPSATIISIVAIPNWVFPGTPIVPTIDYGWGTMSRPVPLPPDDRRNHYASTQRVNFYMPVDYSGWAEPDPRTRAPLLKKLQLRYQPDPFIPASGAPSFDYGWASTAGTRPPLLKKIQLRYQPDPFMPAVVPPIYDYGWASTAGTRPPRLKKLQLRFSPDPFMPAVILPTYDYGWVSTAGIRPPYLKKTPTRYATDQYFPFSATPPRIVMDSTTPYVAPGASNTIFISNNVYIPPPIPQLPLFIHPIVVSISQGFNSTIVTSSDVGFQGPPAPIGPYAWGPIPRPQPRRPQGVRYGQNGTVGVPFQMAPQDIAIGSIAPHVVLGPSNTIVLFRGVFISAPIPPTYNYGWEPMPRPGPRRFQGMRYGENGTVGVAFEMPIYDFGWTEKTSGRKPRPLAKTIQRFSPDPFMPTPIPPTYDYGWFARPRLPVQLKPSNVQRLTPDTFTIVTGRVTDYGWTVVAQRPTRIKPSNGIYLGPFVHVIQRGSTTDYGWTVIPQRPFKPWPPLGRLRPQDYFPIPLPGVMTHVTGMITDPAGNPATSGYVLFTLQGGAAEHQIYRVTGTTVIINRTVSAPIDINGNISIYLWGNNLITPAGSWYRVTFAPNGTIRKVVNHVYISGQTYDITNPVFI